MITKTANQTVILNSVNNVGDLEQDGRNRKGRRKVKPAETEMTSQRKLLSYKDNKTIHCYSDQTLKRGIDALCGGACLNPHEYS
jgi:hypothetical protein